VESKSATQRWAQQREAELLRAGKASIQPAVAKKEVPTLQDFWPRFIKEHCKANQHKPSGIERKECVYRNQLSQFADKRLNEFTNADIQSLKGELVDLQPKSINNVLTTLSACLKFAVDIGDLDAMPCKIKLFKPQKSSAAWYESPEYERLCDAASKIDPRIHALVRLGGDAGLRRGEIIALKWSDVDFAQGHVHVRRSVWHGHETVPKGVHARVVDMTDALRDALKKCRHVRGERVLYTNEGRELTAKVVRNWLARAQRRANLEVTTGAIHKLRHTFCSILATRGASPKAIQELAGHADIGTTMRYMHLSPSSRKSAIGLLNQPRQPLRGDILETAAS